ncbi:MAG: TrkA family potassium uptake protein [Haloferacaceae archaeon]
MASALRRVGAFLAVSTLAIVAYALLYQFGMAALEGHQRTFMESLFVVIETFTTTGYGEDAGLWTSGWMHVLMIVMQLSGIALIFTTLPLFVVPLIEDALATSPPTAVDLEDHVVVCRFTPRGDALVSALNTRDVPYVIVEPDRERATQLYEEGYQVIHGDPEHVEDLRNAGAEDALALVADDDDETNAAIVLSARETSADLRVVSLVEDIALADYHRYAGADRVVSPRRMLGESLANKITTSVSAELDGTIEVGTDLEIVELLVQHDSPLVGQTIAESGIGATGANVIGTWFHGQFASPPDPNAVIDEHTVLLVAGREQQLEQLKELTLSTTRRHRRGRAIIAGHGEVGTAAGDALAASEVASVVVDLEDDPGVDIVGDITDRSTLTEAGIEDARSVVLALDDDTTTIFAALVLGQVAPEVEVVARANQTESVGKLYRAGADYVLALSTVSGRLLASELLNEEVLSPETQIDIVRTAAPGLEGRTLREADVRARTGCTVIAIERRGQLFVDLDPDVRIESGDELVVAGTDADVQRFKEFAT